MFSFNNLVYFRMESNNNSTSHSFITTLIVKQKHSFATFCGNVGEIKPVRKIGGKMEGKWMCLISGPKIKGINSVKTVYCDPSMKGSTCAIAQFLHVPCISVRICSDSSNPHTLPILLPLPLRWKFL
jgi:hypothetical protein